MRLLAGARIYQALNSIRRATTPPVSYSPEATKRATTLSNKTAAEVAEEREHFRSAWKAPGKSVLGHYKWFKEYQSSALLRGTDVSKSDPTLLRWYAELLAENQRTAIESRHFERILVPMIRNIGGRIGKWSENDGRKEKLRKWRDDYDGAELDKLVHSMVEYMKRFVDRSILDKVRMCTSEDVERLEEMLYRLNRLGKNDSTVVVMSWNKFAAEEKALFNRQFPIIEILGRLLPNRELFFVERENRGRMPLRRFQTDVNVMKVTAKRWLYNETDDVCAMILAVATRGHLLSNNLSWSCIDDMTSFLKHNDWRTASQGTLLENYLADATETYQNLTHGLVPKLFEPHQYPCPKINKAIVDQWEAAQWSSVEKKELAFTPLVDHSKAAQWIDKEKKELAFTVARETSNSYGIPFRKIEYYSLHID